MDRNIFNFVNRHQVLLEGVKKWYHGDFLRYLKALAIEVRKLLAGVDVENLGELTRTKLTRLFNKLSEAVNKHLGAHATEFLTEFRRFTRIDTIVHRGAFAKFSPTADVSAATIGRVWNAVNEGAIPAFGATAKEAAQSFIARAKDKIRQAVVRGNADNDTVGKVVADILGEGPEYSGGVFRTLAADARAYISTALQHAAAHVTNAVGSIVHDCYQWTSVIDSRTSDICRERHRQIYRVGEGPLPPAHPHCRARAIPCPCGSDTGSPLPGLFAWLKSQPRAFLDKALGGSLAKRVVDGDVGLDELTAIGLIPKLSLDEFELNASILSA